MKSPSIAWLWAILALSSLGKLTAVSQPCILRPTEEGGVCVCTADYCDYLENPEPAEENDFFVVTSSKGGLRFNVSSGKFGESVPHHIDDYEGAEEATSTRKVKLTVNRDVHYQKILGFGGSYTGAVTYLVEFLAQDLRDQLYKSYYSKDGLRFNLMRISIGGCDFDLEPWAYNEYPENDLELSNFTVLDLRDEQRVAHIKRLIEVSGLDNGLRIKGAAWSPPRWMKSNNNWSGRSRLKKEYYQVWADYHLKWLELMEANGLPIWAISTGNEPMNGVSVFAYTVKFMSLGWTPVLQGIWLADNLGPTIRNSKYKDLTLFSNDDQRHTFPMWFRLMNSTRPNSLDYVDGLAVHWYADEWAPPALLDITHNYLKDKMIINTEACAGDKPWQKHKPRLGSWDRGEKYARAFLQDLQHYVSGWIDWNIILDENGGPNYVNNTVDAPVAVFMSNTEEILKQPMFYTIGHFAKFIPENSVRIDSLRSNVNIDTVAFLRPDNTVCVIIFNSGKARVEIRLNDSSRGEIVLNIPQRSIHTVIYK